MCYDIQVGYERKIKDGIKQGAPADEINALIDVYNERFDPDTPLPHVYHHVSAFAHPEVGVVHLKDGELVMEPMTWGLIPPWVMDRAYAHKLWNQTPNARSETMFEKPSFRLAARKRRGVIVIESFFEHHHFAGKAYPFNIYLANGSAMVVAVLWETWVDSLTQKGVKTFSIVTTHGNEFMAALHNNPKQKEPRMPVFLQGQAITDWLSTPATDDNHLSLLPLCQPLPEKQLKAHSVAPLRGKQALGNVPQAVEEFIYPELAFNQTLWEALE